MTGGDPAFPTGRRWNFSLDARMRDLEAVRSRVGLENFALLGSVHGGLVAAAYAATYPDRVSRLVLLSPYASGEDLYRESPSMKLIASLASVTEEQWEFVSTVIAARIHGGDDLRVRAAAELYQAAMEPAAALAFRDANRRIDITEMLPNIECPTLIVHREGFDLSLASFARSLPLLSQMLSFGRSRTRIGLSQ